MDKIIEFLGTLAFRVIVGCSLFYLAFVVVPKLWNYSTSKEVGKTKKAMSWLALVPLALFSGWFLLNFIFNRAGAIMGE